MGFKAKRTTVVLANVIFAYLFVAAQADYVSGVMVGQYIEYDMRVGRIKGDDLGFTITNLTYRLRLDVTDVSGENVTFHVSFRNESGTLLGNGTTPDDKALFPRGMKVNIKTGYCNQSTEQGGWGFIIPANLEANSTVPPTGLICTGVRINRTETRTYLGFNRTISIINYTLIINADPDTFDSLKCDTAFDKESGMLLEAIWIETTSTMPPEVHPRTSLKVTDTNIFQNIDSHWPKDILEYAAVGATVTLIAAVLIGTYMLKRKGRSE